MNSDTFSAKHCGIWDEFFVEPQQEDRELDQVIHQRLSKFLALVAVLALLAALALMLAMAFSSVASGF